MPQVTARAPISAVTSAASTHSAQPLLALHVTIIITAAAHRGEHGHGNHQEEKEEATASHAHAHTQCC